MFCLKRGMVILALGIGVGLGMFGCGADAGKSGDKMKSDAKMSGMMEGEKDKMAGGKMDGGKMQAGKMAGEKGKMEEDK